MKNKIIENDLMRYKKNKFSGNMALLGLVFECLYFMVMYAQIAKNPKAMYINGQPVYTFLTGISVVLNLVMLLAIFLSSEELKGYNKKFSIVVFVLAAIQLIRIVGYPVGTYSTQLTNGKYIFGTGVFLVLIIFLVASAACLITAGVMGLIRSIRLEKFKAELEKGEVDLAAALKEEEPSQQNNIEVVANTEVE